MHTDNTIRLTVLLQCVHNEEMQTAIDLIQGAGIFKEVIYSQSSNSSDTTILEF